MIPENHQIRISVVIPVYGCCASLIPLYERLKESLLKISDNFEIIMVNDASPDNAWEAITKLAQNDTRVIGLNLSRNYGQHYAISAGLDYAQGEWTVVMDCDLQDRPEEIETLYTKAKEGFDIVYGYDDFRGTKSVLNKFFSKSYYWVLSQLSDHESFNPSFIILHSKVVQTFRLYRENKRQFLNLLQEMGFKRTGVAVEHNERPIGISSYTFSKKLKHAFLGITSSSTKLLRAGIILGALSSAASFFYGLFIIIMKLFFVEFDIGWSSIIASIFFVGGVIMILLGILGLYLEVIFYEVKRRPVYTLSETINLNGKTE